MLIYTAFANHRRFLLDCGNLTLLPNGELMLDIANESFFNATAGVTCNAGFDSNTTSITCLATGKWEGAECTPKCKSTSCFKLLEHCYMFSQVQLCYNVYLLTLITSRLYVDHE